MLLSALMKLELVLRRILQVMMLRGNLNQVMMLARQCSGMYLLRRLAETGKYAPMEVSRMRKQKKDTFLQRGVSKQKSVLVARVHTAMDRVMTLRHL